MNHLAENLRLFRTKHRLSARQLSLELNLISDNRIGDIESGNRSIRITEDEIERIANYFDVPSKDLLQKEAKIVFE